MVIDAAGRVTRVDVTAVEPPSPLDGAFRETARAGLSAWRFAAAEKDGQAVASETSVALQFNTPNPFGESEALETVVWNGATDSGFESSRYDYRARILEMETASRRKLADAFAALAEALLKKGQRATAADDWFEVITDFGGPKQAGAILQDVGATYAALNALLGEHIPPRPRVDRIRIYVFGTNAQYQALVAQSAPFEGTTGIYFAAGVVALHAQHPTIGFFLASLLHESTHAFVDRHLTRKGVQLPRWLDEGLAEYMGNSDIKDGKLSPGGHAKRKEIVAGLRTLAFWQTPSRSRTEDAQRAQRQKRALALDEIVAAGPETFYGKDAELYYSQGWLAVHFLRHGRPGWSDTAFPKFLLYVAEGFPADAALQGAYGVPAHELDAGYQRYVKSF